MTINDAVFGELEYDNDFNGNYPLIETTDQLIEKITLVGIVDLNVEP